MSPKIYSICCVPSIEYNYGVTQSNLITFHLNQKHIPNTNIQLVKISSYFLCSAKLTKEYLLSNLKVQNCMV